jgi:hypothetical protein
MGLLYLALNKMYPIYISNMYAIYIKFTLKQATKAQRGSKVIALLFL